MRLTSAGAGVWESLCHPEPKAKDLLFVKSTTVVHFGAGMRA
jgi:hypothetical protein